jgi:outer membrane protein assembly factor BamD (BamD/ComL family)
MPRTRFKRKDLKRPDEFVTHGFQVLNWLKQNVRLVSWAVGGAALAALLIAGFFSVRDARARQANDDLARALAELRDRHYAAAATQLADVANRWHSAQAGEIAGLYAANANLKADNIESAIVLLQEALNARDWPPYLHQQALLDLAFALEQKGDNETAAARYAEAAALDGPYTPMALLGEARVREQLGQKEPARALYERFAREFPQAPEAEVVAAKVEQLKG